MEQLQDFFVHSCVAIFPPIALAWIVAWGERRIIRNACLIWYGFLLLAFGSFASVEGLDWAMIFAMYFLIPAVPIIALVLRGWNWLGLAKTERVNLIVLCALDFDTRTLHMMIK